MSQIATYASGDQELASSHDHRRAADLDHTRNVVLARNSREELGGSVQLLALLDPQHLAQRMPAMPNEVESEGPCGRTGRRILTPHPG